MPSLLWLVVALATVASSGPEPRTVLDFEQRLAAREAIARVQYGHQDQARQAFVQAVPRWALERDVNDMLAQSEVLKALWGVTVTADMLQVETDRIAAATRMPRRLAELQAALGEDPVLVQEALVRPALVSRLFHEKFDNDPLIQAAPRAEAAAIAAALAAGTLDAAAEHPRRRAYDPLSDRPPAALTGAEASPEPRRTVVSGKVVEESEAFVVRVPFQIEGHPMEAEYAVPRVTWEEWWQANGGRFDAAAQLAVVASDTASLRAAGTVSALDGGCPGDVWADSILSQPGPVTGAYTAIWTGSLYVVYSGPSSMARYDPALDAWMPMSSGAPVGYHPPGLWNGSEVDFWGGSVGWDPYHPPYPGLQLGGRYNPITDHWTPYSYSNYSRSGHTYTWVGTGAVLRGGRCEPSYDGSCQAYSPYTGFPWYYDGGAFATAVWTGSKLITYGGYWYYRLGPGSEGYGYGTTNSVSIYDPATGSWSSFVGDAISGGRYNHAAAWDGSRMLVHGGFYSQRSYNSGGVLVQINEARNTLVAYDPETNSWEMLGTLPSYEGTRIVWTGHALLSWGGATGSRFDPATKVFSPIATLNAPAPRSEPAVGWDGEGMFVHGGYFYNAGPLFQSDGGRYFPGAAQEDADGDGYAPCQGDCNDGNAAIHPGAAEACNGVDDDCNAVADEGNPGGGGTCGKSEIGECDYGVVECTAGALACVGAVGPKPEVCNGLDDDCDGVNDNGNPAGGASCGTDVGQCSAGVTDCSAGNLVCRGEVGPQPESCNGLDDDCDGEVPAVESDGDQDGYRGCDGDCDDASGLVHPGSIDMPGNLLDENCDGTAVCSPAMTWNNNGAYVLCVVRACLSLVDAAQATPQQCLAAISRAMRSDVGRQTGTTPSGEGTEDVLQSGGN